MKEKIHSELEEKKMNEQSWIKEIKANEIASSFVFLFIISFSLLNNCTCFPFSFSINPEEGKIRWREIV